MLPAQPVRWGLPAALIGLALFIAIIVGSGLLARVPWIPHTDAVGFSLTLLFYAVLVTYIVAVSRRRGLGRLVRDFGFELRWVDLPIGVGLAILLRIADVLINNLAISTLRLPAAPTSNIDLPKSFVWAVIVGLGVASLVAPIVEELYFRGLVLRAVRNVVIRKSRFEGDRTTRRARTVSILVSAVVFAAFHLYEARNLTMLVVLGLDILAFGLFAGWIATRTRRLGPSIIMHIATNALGVVLALSALPR
jgi:membrane protease YdiL (CAAX protease family)